MSTVLKYKSDLEKTVIISNFERRGWTRTTNDTDWNIYWASVQSIKSIFNHEFGRLSDSQLINHFPNHYELTRKDLMFKNIKRYSKEKLKESSNDVFEFVPSTYNLPTEYNMFVEEFRRNENSLWIMKPTSRSQGKGIFIVNKLSQIKKWSLPTSTPSTSIPSGSLAKEAYIISRYLDSPHLIGGKKYDLRIYVLVTSFHPLRVYQYQHGFARFCNVKYTTNLSDMNNEYIHLTNVAIQSHNENYNATHGGKWSLDNLKLYIESSSGLDMSNTLFYNIDQIIIHSLKSVQNVIMNDKHCFECYGYDILVDSNLRPWLVEVNASPSLSTTTEADRIIKTELLRDIYRIVVPPEQLSRPVNSRPASALGGRVSSSSRSLCFEQTSEKPCVNTGGFYVLYDEAKETGAYLRESSGDPVVDEDTKRSRSRSRGSRPRSASASADRASSRGWK